MGIEDEPLSPACMKCEAVTGNSTCFPESCVFYRERRTPGTKAHDVAVLDQIRRGKLQPVHAATDLTTPKEETPTPLKGDHHVG